MHPIPFKQSNLLLGAGGNPNTSDMPVAVCTHPDVLEGKMPFMISCWRLSAEELAYINEHGHLWVSTMGPQPPPLEILAVDPFKVTGFIPKEL